MIDRVPPAFTRKMFFPFREHVGKLSKHILDQRTPQWSLDLSRSFFKPPDAASSHFGNGFCLAQSFMNVRTGNDGKYARHVF